MYNGNIRILTVWNADMYAVMESLLMMLDELLLGHMETNMVAHGDVGIICILPYLMMVGLL